MRTLSRYFVARFVQFFLAVVLVAILSITIVELMLNVDRMLAFGDGFRAILTYLGLRLASEYASYVVPIACFLSAFLCAGLSAYTHETIALKASGISPLRIALPLLACGSAAAAGYAFFHETVVVESRREWNRQRDGDENISFESGSFWYQRGTRIYNVAEADRTTRTLHDVRIFERDERGRLRESVAAARIEIVDPLHWRFEDAVVRHFDPDDPAATVRVERLESEVRPIADARDRALLGADPTALSLARLREFIVERERRGGSARTQRVLLHERLCDWIAIGLLAACGIPIGFGVEKTRNLGRSSGYAVATLAGYYALRNVAAVVSLQQMVPPGTAAWTLVGAGGVFALVAFARVPR